MCTAGERVSLTITGPGPSFFVRDGILSVADYNSTLMGVVVFVVVVVVVVVVVYFFTMG